MKFGKNILICCSLLILLLSGCTTKVKITEGEIYHKDYREPYTSHGMIFTGQVTVPTTQHHFEVFKISIKQFDEETQEWLTSTYEVSKEQFESLQIGDVIYIEE